MCVCLYSYDSSWRWKWKIDHVNMIYMDVAPDVGTNLVNIKIVSVWWCLYVLSNT